MIYTDTSYATQSLYLCNTERCIKKLPHGTLVDASLDLSVKTLSFEHKTLQLCA
jgi:hypothetical protein